MVYNTQNHSVSGLCSTSVILNNYEKDLFPCSDEGREHLLCWVQWLRLALSKGLNTAGVSLA
jgi:hypothetical protein